MEESFHSRQVDTAEQINIHSEGKILFQGDFPFSWSRRKQVICGLNVRIIRLVTEDCLML